VNPTPSSRNLGGTFAQLFTLSPALDQDSIAQVHRVRHDVYCRDLGWEPVREDGMEIDAYDRHSIHCLLRRRDTGAPVGCTRLILTRPEAPETPLPFEDSCKDVIDRSLVDPARLPRDTVGEVSRLAVMNTFRQRKGEAATEGTVSEDDFESQGGMPRFPFIPVSLYLGAAAIARHMGVEHVFVLTEPRLASHFTRIGFDIRSIGGTIEHRGTRMPSVLSSSKVVAGLRPLIKPLYGVIADSVEQAFLSHPEFARSMRASLL
jgi:N-acyl amino acid synthase of PEP-CTERM/exosortase system